MANKTYQDFINWFVGMYQGPAPMTLLDSSGNPLSLSTSNLALEAGHLATIDTSTAAILADTADIETSVANISSNGYPVGATPITGSSGNVANGSAVATLAHVTGKTTWITGFEVTGSGATVGGPVIVTVTNVITGTMSYIYSAMAGVLLENTPLIVPFPREIPATGINVDIVVTCPALGSGNTNNAVVAHGYVL